MPRDDSFLNTGVSSAAYRKQTAQKAAAKQASEDKKGKLTPAAELIITLIEKEKTDITDIRSFVMDAQSTPEDIKAQLLARQLHVEFLTRFQNKITNLLRKKGENDG